MSDSFNRYERALMEVAEARVTHRLSERTIAAKREELDEAEVMAEQAMFALNDAEQELLAAREEFESASDEEAEEKLRTKAALA